MEAIIRAFERLEKTEQKKKETMARSAQRKESGGAQSDDDRDIAVLGNPGKSKPHERPVRRKRRKGRARTVSGSRRARLNSADSDVSSGDESTSMQSPLPGGQAAIYSPQDSPVKESRPSISTDAGLLLALANSSMPGPSSPGLQNTAANKSPTCDSAGSTSSQSSNPSTPLSSACLLVAAAVGPLAPGFKFPKTKKVLMNEWLKEAPEPTSNQTPRISSPSANSLVHQNVRSQNANFGTSADSTGEFLAQTFAAKGLATLVQAANKVSGIVDSPPVRTAGNSGCTGNTGSAKKRWLRQAISEECESPNGRPESPVGEVVVAPPKKRRFARESLSGDNYTPPTTPTMIAPDVNSASSGMGNNEVIMNFLCFFYIFLTGIFYQFCKENVWR